MNILTSQEINTQSQMLKQQKTPLLTGQSSEDKRSELKRYFENSWQTYESLFSLINSDDAFYLRPERLRHPLIFYYGHTATFFINKLMLGKYISSRINGRLEAICAVGVDEMSWDDIDSQHYDWPRVAEVRDYRQQVYALINQLIDDMPLSLPISQNSLAWVILMGCEHERIHLETSSVIMRMLPLHYLTPTEQWAECPYVGDAPKNDLVSIQGKSITLGKQSNDATYGWDNEYGELHVDVDNFNASKFLVSNQEYLTFVEAGGYQEPKYWTKEGKSWLAFSQATIPRFWFKKADQYFQRNLLHEIPLPLNWPVEINYLEAKAFCQWKSIIDKKNIRLPTEAEWYCLRENIKQGLDNWIEAPGNINLEYFASSSPIDSFEHQGLYDICGNVWQWTESAIDGFDGFKVHPLYDDFSTPTFDGKHNLIKGGSWISTGNEAIKSSRYAFRRHFFQHAGFRYIESENAEVPTTKMNFLETDVEICQQLANHYPEESSSNYVEQLADYIQKVSNNYFHSASKVLHLGCSVGGVTYKLSPCFKYIDGVDFSARFIQYGVKLQQNEQVRYQSIIQGDIVEFNEIRSEAILKNYRGNIIFSQGDAVNLKTNFDGYDVIVLQQVLEQSYDPILVLENIKARLNHHGLLIVASSYIFNENVTDKSKWLGGVKVNGENVSGFDGLNQQLSNTFVFKEQKSLIETLQLNQNQKQQTTIDVSVWQLKDE